MSNDYILDKMMYPILIEGIQNGKDLKNKLEENSYYQDMIFELLSLENSDNNNGYINIIVIYEVVRAIEEISIINMTICIYKKIFSYKCLYSY